MMSARDQRAETSKIQQNGGTKDGRKDKLKGKKFLNIKRLYTRRNGYFLDLAAKLKGSKKKGNHRKQSKREKYRSFI